MSNKGGALQIERFDEGGQIVRVRVEVISAPRLAGATLATPVLLFG